MMMKDSYVYGMIIFLLILSYDVESGRLPFKKVLEDDTEGTKWAVLVAGSMGYWNYRHQADVCHAYQILKNGGLKDENIIVFMYDDIAFNEENPTPGIIINKPDGEDVYKGVPKDYTGEDVTINNLFNVILGNASALTGGSGKVVNSGPKDYIFIYYSDHGAPGEVEMPYESLYADDLIDVLKKKHSANSYKSMVFYLEACESGSMFEGLLPHDLNIYATTASNATESSWAAYCPKKGTKYNSCLGDLYSISWLEDSDENDMMEETLEDQYQTVRDRTLRGEKGPIKSSSHVMQYGNMELSTNYMATYLGGSNASDVNAVSSNLISPSLVNQRDGGLIYLQHTFHSSLAGSPQRIETLNKLYEEIYQRKYVDSSIRHLGVILFGSKDGSKMLNAIRPRGKPVVDDWDCLKKFVKLYEENCGLLSSYGRKHLRGIANICNAGISVEQFSEASSQACFAASTEIEVSFYELGL